MKVALISCVKSKQDGSHMAKDLYTSPLFRMNYAYAKKTCDKVFILSAKYGLLAEDDMITWYEKTLTKVKKADRQAWADKVIARLRTETDLANDEFLILAGEVYRENLLPHLHKTEIPFYKMGFGKQLQKLKESLA